MNNNPEYKKHHPDVIEDIDKAHAMGLASNNYRTGAAELRLQATKLSRGETFDSKLTIDGDVILPNGSEIQEGDVLAVQEQYPNLAKDSFMLDLAADSREFMAGMTHDKEQKEKPHTQGALGRIAAALGRKNS